MRVPTTTVFLAVILALFSFYGAIDVRSSAYSMSSTSTTSSLQIPSGPEVFTIDVALPNQAPFQFISSPFGDISSWIDEMGPGNEDK